MEKSKVAAGGKMTDLIIGFLIYIPIFDKIIADELRLISKYMNVVEADPGEVIFKEGEKGDYVCFVVNGSLDVIKKSETGKNIVISTLSKGRSIGEMSVIDDSPRSATVKARTKSTLVTLSQEKLNIILEEHCSIGVKILKGISRLLSLNMRKTSSRLADYMLPIS